MVLRLRGLIPAVLLLAAGCNRGPKEVQLDVEVVAVPASASPSGDGEQAAVAFVPRELFVPAETLVAINLRNGVPGGPPHNFVLVQPGSVEKVAAAAARLPKGSDPGHLPTESEVLASSPLVAPGATVQFRFTAPTPGYYEFLCTGPGGGPNERADPHALLRGKLVVE